MLGIFISRCAHPFCERKCANASVGLKNLAAVFLMLLSITAMLKLLLRGATRWMSLSRGCLGLVITLVGSRERFERIGSEERPKIHR